MRVLLVLLVIVVLVGLFLVLQYNGLIKLRNRIEGAWAQIDVQLRRRYDLIPNLVETVKAFAAHEREVLESVTRARSEAAAPGSGWQAQEHLHHEVGRLIARSEAYPDLKSDRQFLMLQRQLAECEAQIAAARRSYNTSVMDYHNTVDMFPSSLVARMFSFKHKPAFEIAVAERSRPDVRF